MQNEAATIEASYTTEKRTVQALCALGVRYKFNIRIMHCRKAVEYCRKYQPIRYISISPL